MGMEKKIRINEWAEGDRPREKLLEKGASALTNTELLAILIRSGTRNMNAMETARCLINKHDNSLYALVRTPIEKMMRIKGIGPAKAAALAAAFELGRRGQVPVERPASITSAREVADMMIPMLKDLTYETCWVLFFDGARKYIGREQVSSGGLNATIVDIRMVLKKALDKLSCEIGRAHV